MTLNSIRLCLIILALPLLLAAIGGCGNTSVPSAPAGLTISSTVSQNTLSWNAVSGCSYNIYRGTSSGSEVLYNSSTATTFIDTPPVSSSTPYYYVVTAINTNGESVFSNEVSVTPPTLTLGTVTSSTVNLSWSMPATVSGVTSYNIYRSTATGAEGLPVLGSTATTSFTDTTVFNNGTMYYYRVTAVGTNGETLGSNEVSTTP
jgi:fibronectin type 3 domain-containing protein